MSIATLNRIVREQTVFCNTKKERDAMSPKIRYMADLWSQAEVNLLLAGVNAYQFQEQFPDRTFTAIRKKRTWLRQHGHVVTVRKAS